MAKNDSSWTIALLRVVLGVIFAYHGYLKLFVPGGFKGTAAFLASLGIPLPLYSALIVSAVEFFGGVFLILGMVTRWSTVLLIIDMLVAFFLVHMKNGLLVSKGGYEFVLVLLAGLAVVLANGAGKFSLGSKYFKSGHLK
ncbi:DoxX family protein [Candidatus Woesearchaeota archaeon]|nr:DoxX family protein [Candidatus Woesearchaeota archaeon]